MLLKIGLIVLISTFFAACSTRIDYTVDQAESLPNAVNINTATVSELEQLPNIGRKTAESIVTFRNESGPFRRVEHVMLIRGVSEARFLELRPYLRAD